jgi:hypothetical protein
MGGEAIVGAGAGRQGHWLLAGWHPRRAFSGRRRWSVLRVGHRVAAAGCDARSAERRDRSQALERGGECLGPGPIAVELELGATSVTDELGGRMEQPVAMPTSAWLP